MFNQIFYLFIFFPVFGFSQFSNNVFDNQEVLSLTQKKNLERVLNDYKDKHNASICIYITDSIEELSAYNYSLKVSSESFLIRNNLNNGVFIFIFPKLRKVQLQIGYGMEWRISSDLSKKIIKDIVPRLKNEDYYDACLVAIEKVRESSKDVDWMIKYSSYKEYQKNRIKANNSIVKFYGKWLGFDINEPRSINILTSNEDTISIVYTNFMLRLIDDLRTEDTKLIYVLIDDDLIKLIGVE